MLAFYNYVTKKCISLKYRNHRLLNAGFYCILVKRKSGVSVNILYFT